MKGDKNYHLVISAIVFPGRNDNKTYYLNQNSYRTDTVRC